MDTIRPSESGTTLLTCDIAIVGGGSVGLALACALASQSNLSIVLLESIPERAVFSADHYHHRVSAISLSSVNIFKSLGVWSAMTAQRVSGFSGIKVWDADHPEDLAFNSNEIGEPLLGYIIENIVVQNALETKLRTLPNVRIISPIQLTSMHNTADAVILNECIKAKIAVAADGANSWLRQQAGIAVQGESYDQEAIVATVTTTKPHEKIARQVFLPQGPLAFLPLDEAHTCSIVWSNQKPEAQRLMALDDQAFSVALAAAFGQRLGEVKKISKRYIFPLKKQQAANYVAGRIVLVGDAAHVVHPLAGQGVNLGLLDAASLAEIILEAIKSKADFSASSCLRRYERWRRADNIALLTGVDILKQIFASDNVSIKTMRSVGLALTRRLGLLRNIFTRYAVGHREGLPQLAKTYVD